MFIYIYICIHTRIYNINIVCVVYTMPQALWSRWSRSARRSCSPMSWPPADQPC